MSENNNMVAVIDGQNFIVDLTSASSQYSSVVAQTPLEKAKLYSMVNNPTKRLADMINLTINVKDIYCEVVECTQESTGELIACPRIVLIDEEGESYQCVSLGIHGAIKKLIAALGEPTWSPAVPLLVRQVAKGERKFLTLDINFKEFEKKLKTKG